MGKAIKSVWKYRGQSTNVNGMLFVVDITADQFGMDKIVYKGLKDAPEYIEGHQITIDEHVHETLHQIIGSYSSEYNQL